MPMSPAEAGVFFRVGVEGLPSFEQQLAQSSRAVQRSADIQQGAISTLIAAQDQLVANTQTANTAAVTTARMWDKSMTSVLANPRVATAIHDVNLKLMAVNDNVE